MLNYNDALNLYSKVEDLLGVKEVAPKLYSYYFEILKDIKFDSLLDIGCGSGDFLYTLDSINICSRLLGIDKSDLMVEATKKRELDAKNIELKDINEKFDIAVATFDMVNYLKKDELNNFFRDLNKVIKKDGYFIFDVNTLYGLSELAIGNFIAQDENRFVTIESFYEDGIYESFFTLFQKEKNECYKKESQQINQYYYDLNYFKGLKNWKIEKYLPISLYETDDYDKNIIVLKNCI